MKRHLSYWLPILTVSFILASVAIFWTTSQAEAQCGSQASSCKNCHETQGKKPVSNDGKAWHKSHAFGDFCQFCHAGNVQSMDQNEAHKGMEKPLANVKLSCSSCHQKDYTEKAQIYATTLGVTLTAGGSGGSTPPPTAAAGGSTPAPTQSAQTASPAQPMAAPVDLSSVPSGAIIIDFNQQYAETVEGKVNINWGDVILAGLLVVLIVGGTGFVIYNEGVVKWLLGDTKKLEGEYPADVVNLIPELANLKPEALKSLKNILANPKKAEKILDLLDAAVKEK